MAKTANASDIEAGLGDIYTQISQLKLSPDAGQYMGLIDQLGNAVLQIRQKIVEAKSQQAAQMQQMQRQQAINGAMGGPQQGAGMPQRPPAGQPGGPPSQGSPGLAMPNADELRRVLQSQGQGG